MGLPCSRVPYVPSEMSVADHSAAPAGITWCAGTNVSLDGDAVGAAGAHAEGGIAAPVGKDGDSCLARHDEHHLLGRVAQSETITLPMKCVA